MSRETDRSPGQEGYWSELAERDPDTVLDRLRDRMGGDLLRVAVTAKRGTTCYMVVSRLVEQHGRETVDMRTVVLDGDDLRVTDNGMWVPADSDVLDQLRESANNAAGHVAMGTAGDGPTTGSAVDGLDPSLLLDREVAPDVTPEAVHGWGVEWGNGNGPPEAVHDLVARLREAGVEAERFSRLEFGAKVPHERYGGRGADDLLGNYGVETVEGDALVVVDVDAPDDAPVEDMPETYRVSSPHGDDDRAHHYLRVEEVEEVEEYVGSGAGKPGWGDVWLSGEYVVGPGSVLTDCGKDGCDVCAGPGGRYEVVGDAPIATVEADWLIDLLDRSALPDSPLGRRRDGGDDDDEQREPVEADDDPTTPAVLCDDCGAELDSAEADLVDRDGVAVYVCGGGCDE